MPRSRLVVPFALLAGVALAGESGLPLVPGWVETRAISSPAATQAAATLGARLYAISNRTIATHDRASGSLLALASSETAEHLNSGFFHEGRLFCAHSNYPHQPHRSDIRVFDPGAGSLRRYHDFPDPPGSLVWCLVRRGDWWCCFAHYGDENARTLLVTYEDGRLERERARYRFPARVIADFDGMSASGGIWDGDTLLVTHHHHRVIYRLRLPDHGDRLELVEALQAPFPGQGIARDPTADAGDPAGEPIRPALVGIDRGRRAIVLAEDCRTALRPAATAE